MRCAANRSKGNPTGIVITTGGFDEAQRSGSSQLFPLDVAREVHRNLEDNVLHQWQMLFDESGEILRRHFAHE
jgi:hypothetical protein